MVNAQVQQNFMEKLVKILQSTSLSLSSFELYILNGDALKPMQMWNQ